MIIRITIETMQRCALEDFAPIPIGFETKQSILARWIVFTRKRILGQLEDRQKAAVKFQPLTKIRENGVEEEFIPSEDSWNDFSSIELREITNTVTDLLSRPNLSSCKVFYTLAREMSLDAWSIALGAIDHCDDQIAETILKCVDLCHSNRDLQPSEEFYKSLLKRFLRLS